MTDTWEKYQMAVVSSTVVLSRGDFSVRVQLEEWARILIFLSKVGWKPDRPSLHWLAADVEISQEDAFSLGASGQIVLEEIQKDPLSAVEALPFDWGKLAEIVVLCEEGAFRISRE